MLFEEPINISNFSKFVGIINNSRMEKTFSSDNSTKYLDIVNLHYKDNSLNRYQGGVSLSNIPTKTAGYDTFYHNSFTTLVNVDSGLNNYTIQALWLE